MYKAGHTTNKLEKRLAGYLGPSKPRNIIFSRSVENSHQAEKLMLNLMRQCVAIVPREDLGDEWFQAVAKNVSTFHNSETGEMDTIVREFSFEERQRQLEAIAKVVQQAIKSMYSLPPRMEQTGQSGLQLVKDATPNTAIRGLEDYFAEFDKYVQEVDAENLKDAETLIQSYEDSNFCPVNKFLEFLPYGKDVRTNVAKARYRKLLGNSMDL